MRVSKGQLGGRGAGQVSPRLHLSSGRLAQQRFLPWQVGGPSPPARPDPGRRMRGLRWRYTRLVRGPAWAGVGSGKVQGGQLSGRVGPELAMNAGRWQVTCSSSKPLPSWPAVRSVDSGAGGLRWQPHGHVTPGSTDCYSVSSSLEQVPGGALPGSPTQQDCSLGLNPVGGRTMSCSSLICESLLPVKSPEVTVCTCAHAHTLVQRGSSDERMNEYTGIHAH